MIVVVPRVIARTLGVKTMRLPTSRRQKQNDVVERTGRSVISITVSDREVLKAE
jgi:hypothetical protein